MTTPRTIGEGGISGVFPSPQSEFSIQFYGARGKRNLYISLYKQDGSLLSNIVIPNVKRGPYGFKEVDKLIKGFSMYTDDVGGIGIYKIRYKDIEVPSFFLDTFTGTGDLSTHVSDSEHIWIVPTFWFPELYPLENIVLDGNGYIIHPGDSQTYFMQPDWSPSTSTWYFELDIYAAAYTPFKTLEFSIKETDDGMYYGPTMQLTTGSTYTIVSVESQDENFVHYEEYTTLVPSNTEFTARIEIINNARIRFLIEGNIIFDSDTATPPGDLTYPNPIVRPILRFNQYPSSSIFKISRAKASDFTV